MLYYLDVDELPDVHDVGLDVRHPGLLVAAGPLQAAVRLRESAESLVIVLVLVDLNLRTLKVNILPYSFGSDHLDNCCL